MAEVAKMVIVSVLGGAVTASLFFMADAALPDDAPWWVRWALAVTSFVSYSLGGAMGAWQTRRLYGTLARERDEMARLEAAFRRALAEHDGDGGRG